MEYLLYRSRMNFWERVQNFLMLCYGKYTRISYLETQQEMSKQAYGLGVDDLREVEKKFDLLLINSGPPGIDLGRSLPPNVKKVGCMHCRPGNTNNLPKVFQVFYILIQLKTFHFKLYQKQ